MLVDGICPSTVMRFPCDAFKCLHCLVLIKVHFWLCLSHAVFLLNQAKPILYTGTLLNMASIARPRATPASGQFGTRSGSERLRRQIESTQQRKPVNRSGATHSSLCPFGMLENERRRRVRPSIKKKRLYFIYNQCFTQFSCSFSHTL